MIRLDCAGKEGEKLLPRHIQLWEQRNHKVCSNKNNEDKNKNENENKKREGVHNMLFWYFPILVFVIMQWPQANDGLVF